MPWIHAAASTTATAKHVHAGTTLVATGLALADARRQRRRCPRGNCLGYEAAVASGRRSRPLSGTRVPRCLVAIFGGAVASDGCCSSTRPVWPSNSTVRDVDRRADGSANTSVAREYHAGLAAMLGVQAALAAQRGYKAEESILERAEVSSSIAGQTARAWSESWAILDIITTWHQAAPGGHPLPRSRRGCCQCGQRSSTCRKRSRASQCLVQLTALPATAPDRSDRMAHAPPTPAAVAAIVTSHGFMRPGRENGDR